MKNKWKSVKKRLLQPARDACALQRLAGFDLGYIPWSGAAMRPEAVLLLVNEILVNQRGQILELGSGISTIYGAAAIAEKGSGFIDSVDQDQDWINVVEGQLRKRGLSDYVRFHYAPLVNRVDLDWPDETVPVADYYDSERIEGRIEDKSKDLLVVDAPTAFEAGREYARFPALQVFRRYLADEFTIMIDDVGRIGERTAIESWARDLRHAAKIDERREIGMIATGKRWTV